MPDKIHCAVQDTGNLHVVRCETVKHDMLPRSHLTVGRSIAFAHEWVLLNGSKSLVENGCILLNLLLSPHLHGVGKNIAKILYGFIGKAEAVGFTR